MLQAFIAALLVAGTPGKADSRKAETDLFGHFSCGVLVWAGFSEPAEPRGGAEKVVRSAAPGTL